MPDYSKGKIYKILNTIDDNVYVGSTVETLSLRMAKHRSHVKARPHFKLYEHMNELGVENFYIELIENCPCNDIYELRAREGHYIRKIGTLNKLIAGRTLKEYQTDNKEHIKEYNKQYKDEHKEEIKQYREEHKEHIKEYMKQYIEEHKEHIKLYKKQHYEKNKEHIKEYMKQYREEHKEHIKETKKQHYENNKEHILQRNSENIVCNMCGGHICKSVILRHQKSKKCKSIAESKNKQTNFKLN